MGRPAILNTAISYVTARAFKLTVECQFRHSDLHSEPGLQTVSHFKIWVIGIS
jgi:hypothetical protein